MPLVFIGSSCEPAMPLDVAEFGVTAIRTRASMQIMHKPNLEKSFIMRTPFPESETHLRRVKRKAVT